ncbi:MAG: hypothetical protein L3J95_03420 [Thermoplasmata archaeon]|nr:hypothetical protein [Thermoplasmata archaeon]MCI4359457.1 hypothetical protein [Thermoplasmata archaeon]
MFLSGLERRMATIGFEGLPPYSWPGGAIAGTVVVEADKPARGRNLTVHLEGKEIAQATVQAGKSSEKVVEERVFLQQECDIHQDVTFVDPDHLAPGVYRAPFQFALPPTATPSIHTSEYAPGGGVFNARPDGMFVEYTVEARLQVPLWADLVARAIIPVFSPRRVLGIVPTMQSASNPGHPALSVGVSDPSPLLPGGTLQAFFEVQNPGGKKLRYIQYALTRVIQYHARGVARIFRTPTLVVESPLDGTASSYSGSFQIPVPNNDAMTGPWQGQLFVTFWSTKAVLDVEFGLNVEVELALTPA